MMELEQRKAAFVQLAKVLKPLSEKAEWPGYACGLGESEYHELTELIERVKYHNPWFTPENVRKAMAAWAENLSEDVLEKWLKPYRPEIDLSAEPKRVGIVMAGNIPMVGFHDLLSVLISGHRAIIKMSSDDNLLIPALISILITIEPEFKSRITIAERLNEIDAVIATGSNNSSRYFDYYFSKYPHIIRKNRNSLAVIENDMSDEDLRNIGEDVFAFFGLGCRNVTHLLLPEDFDIDRFFKAILPYHDIVNHNKYANNYDYYKALYLMNRENLLDNGFILLRPSNDIYSALGTLHYRRYDQPEAAVKIIEEHREMIQCVVGNNDLIPEAVSPGKSQQPALWDYADGVDTLDFLGKI